MIDSLALGIYGQLRSNAKSVEYLSRDERPDCYSVFHSLSQMYGLASDAHGGVWGMNDADGPMFTTDQRSDLLGWFQVTPTVAPSVPLPVELFTTCAMSTLKRFGDLKVSGLVAYFPVSGRAPDSWAAFGAKSWLDMGESAARCSALVTIEMPHQTDAEHIIGRVSEWLAKFEENKSGISLTASDEIEVGAARRDVPWRWWISEDRTVERSLTVSLPEWSSTALGWALGCVERALEGSGFTGGAGIRIDRSETTG